MTKIGSLKYFDKLADVDLFFWGDSIVTKLIFQAPLLIYNLSFSRRNFSSFIITVLPQTLRFVKNYKSPSVLVTAFLLLPVNTQTTLYSLKHEIGLHCSLFRLIISKKKVMSFRIHQMKVFYVLSLVKSCSLAYTIFITLIHLNHISTFPP